MPISDVYDIHIGLTHTASIRSVGEVGVLSNLQMAAVPAPSRDFDLSTAVALNATPTHPNTPHWCIAVIAVDIQREVQQLCSSLCVVSSGLVPVLSTMGARPHLPAHALYAVLLLALVGSWPLFVDACMHALGCLVCGVARLV